MKANPCYKCSRRHPKCHSSCKEYKDWKNHVKEVNKNRHKDDSYTDYVTTLIENNRRDCR
jgi:hypothetical protein